MTTPESHNPFTFEISLSTLNHLGRNLYQNFITVLGEAISNSWDADAENVWIRIDRDNSRFIIIDDGIGMNEKDFQDKFLKIGYSKRRAGHLRSPLRKRPYIGAKGIGKLALLSCAKRVSITSIATEGKPKPIGGVIDNTLLDEAIAVDRSIGEYQLGRRDISQLDRLDISLKNGTVIEFSGADEITRHSEDYIRKLLALAFKFSLLEPSFKIFVNDDKDDKPVSIQDLQSLSDATQFLWTINDYQDDFTKSFQNLESEPVNLSIDDLDVKGFIASVKKPANLKITGTDERATIDLFVNGRLREKNIIRHIPSQRVVENYIYGQIDFDILDQGARDPFTSSREGVIGNNELFQSLMKCIKTQLLPKVIDEWDKFRLKVKDEGDDENKRMDVESRKAAALVSVVSKGFEAEKDSPLKDDVEKWLRDMRPDVEYNSKAYVYCFLSENLLRKFISYKKLRLKAKVDERAKRYQESERKGMAKANISINIRSQSHDLLSYLSMDDLGDYILDTQPTISYASITGTENGASQ